MLDYGHANNSNKKKMIIERDTDLFTPEEVMKHDKEVMAAIMDELKDLAEVQMLQPKTPQAGTLHRGLQVGHYVEEGSLASWKHKKNHQGPTHY